MVVPRMPQAAQVQAKRKTIPAMRLVTAPPPSGPRSLARRCFNVKYFVSQSYGGGAPAGRAGFSPSTRQPINQQSRRTPAPLGRYRGATDPLPSGHRRNSKFEKRNSVETEGNEFRVPSFEFRKKAAGTRPSSTATTQDTAGQGELVILQGPRLETAG